MKVNLAGLARQASKAIRPKDDTGAYAFMLEELADHAEMVRLGKASLQDFADAYCLTPDTEAASG